MHAGRRFRLGLLTLLAGVAFFSLLGFVLQGVLRNDRVTYYILFEENVKGMVVGSKANFQGVPIGMVQDIRFQNGRTLVELSVDPTKADIQDLTRARLDRLLVTGQVTVELEGYGPEGQSLRPGQFIQPKADPINQLTRTLPEVVPQISDLLKRSEVLLDRGIELIGDDNRAHLAAILKNLDAATTDLPQLVAELRSLSQRADAELIPAGTRMANAAEAALVDLRRVGAQLGSAAVAGEALLSAVRGPAQTALASLRTSLDDLRGFARQLRLAPDSLIFGVSRPASPVGGER